MLAEAALALLSLGWLLVAAAAFGRKLLRLLRIDFSSIADELPFAAGLGMAGLAYPLFMFGSAGFVSVWIAVGSMAAMTLLSTQEIRSLIADVWAARISWRRQMKRLSWPWKVLAGGIFVFFVLELLASLAPPTFSDSLRHSLAAPKYYIRHGQVAFQPVLWWNISALVEMLFMWGLLLGNDLVATLVNYSYVVLAALAVFAFARRYLSTQVAWLAVGMFIASPAIITRIAIPKPEMALTFYFTTAVLALLYWIQRRAGQWLVLSAAFAGFAAFSKLHGVPLVAILILCVLTASLWLQPRRPGIALRNALLFSLVAGAFAAPLYARNWIASGDPFWPFAYAVFRGRYWNLVIHQRWMAWDLGVGEGLTAFLTTPWYFTMDAARFGDLRLFVPPTFLAFIPAIVWFRSRLSLPVRQMTAWLLMVLFLYYAQWFIFYTNSAYIFYVWPLLGLLAGIGAMLALAQGRLLRAVATLAIAGIFAVNILLALAATRPFLPAALGVQSREEFLRSQVWYYDDLVWLNRNLSPGSKILFLPLASYYYLDQEYAVGAAYYQGVMDYAAYKGANGLLCALVRRGFTHVVVDSGALGNVLEYIVKARKSSVAQEEPFQALMRAGSLVPIYHNPVARRVESRVLGYSRAAELTVYEVRRPQRDCDPAAGRPGG